MKPGKGLCYMFLLVILGVTNINNNSGIISYGNNIARTADTWAPEGERRQVKTCTTREEECRERADRRRPDGSNGGPQQSLRETVM